LVYITKHGLVATPPKLVGMNHLMEEHFPKGRWMVVLECVVNVTTLVMSPKKILIVGEANHHLCLLKNGFNIAI
jgi:hypothetical protein